MAEVLQVLYAVGLGIVIGLFWELKKARSDLASALKENRDILRATTESNNTMAQKIIELADEISKTKQFWSTVQQQNQTRR